MTPPSNDDYIEVAIRSVGHLTDHYTGILSQLGFEGFWEDGEVLRCYIPGKQWSARYRSEVEEVIGMISRSSGSRRPELMVSESPAKNWNEHWERTIQPIAVGDRLIIRPSWQPVTLRAGQVELIIDPKMSFGTGYHETTRLTLKLLEKHLNPGSRVLDVGTGTGILAIAAVKLGADSAVALDTDDWACENAIENVKRNGTNVRVLSDPLSSLTADRFGLIMANIQRDVLTALLDEMEKRLEPKGTMLLSGLLTSDLKPFNEELLRRELRVADTGSENEWAAMVVVKPEMT